MSDKLKSKTQLISELAAMRQRMAELEKITYEQKSAGEALRKSEKRYRDLVENTSDWVWEVDTGIHFTYTNPRVADLLGYSQEEVLGKTPFDFMPSEEDIRHQPIRNDLMTCPRAFQGLESEHIHKNGSTSILEINAMPIYDTSGRFAGYRGIARDITARKVLEEALQESENRFRSIVENSAAGYFFIDREGRFKTINAAWLRLHKYDSPSEILGRHFSVTQVDADQFAANKIVERLLAGEEITQGEFTRRCKDGSIGWHTFTVNPVWQGGKVVGLEGFLIDITERKRAEEALRAASLYSRTLIETSLDPLVTISAEGKITDVNAATEKITGMSRERLIGSDFTDYFTEPEMARAGYLKVFERGQVTDYPLAIRHTSGAITEVLYNASVYQNEQGEVIGVFAAARDITERKRAEEALRASEEKYRTLFEESFDGLFITSPDGKILDMNKKGILMFGYETKEEILSLDLERDVYAYPPDRMWILAMVNAQGTAEYEVIVKKKSGEQMMTHCSLTAVRDEQGVITAYRGIIRDITERKKAEEALRAASLYMRSLIEASLDPLVTISSEGKITDVNRATEQVTGVLRERLIGDDFTNYFTEPEKAREGYQKVLTDGLVRDYPLTISHTSGETTNVLYNATIYRNELGETQGVFAVARDITERNRSEMALRNHMEFLETMINTIPTPIYYKDREGVYLGCNIQYASMIIGLPKERIIGRTTLDLTETIPPEIAQRYHAQDMELIHIPGFRVYDEDLSCPDGTLRSYIFSKATYTDAQGNVSGMVGIMLDISERKQVEKELKESERNLSIRNTIAEIFLTCPVEEMYGEVLKVLLDITRSKHGLFGFMDEEMTLVVPSFIGNIENTRISENLLRIPWAALSGEIIGQAIAEKKSMLSNMPGTVPEGHILIDCVLVVPIVFQKKTIGVFIVANNASGYGGHEQRLMEGIAEQVAPILHARLQREKEEQGRKQAEEAQRSQLLFLQQLLDSIPPPVFYKDIQGVYLGCNKAYLKFMGLAKDQIVGKTVFDLAPKDLAELYLKADTELFNNPGVQVYETSVSHADGSMHDVIFNKATYVGSDGHIAGLVGVILDITERKRVERILLRQNEALEQSLDGIAMIGIDNDILYVNPAWAAMHAYTPDELKGVNLSIFHTPEQMENEVLPCLKAAKEKGSYRAEIGHRKKDGTIFPTRMSCVGLKDTQANPIGQVVFSRDITEELRLESLLRQAQKMEAVGQLAGGIAHDFNNMLSPILGYADLLLSEIKPENKYYQEILQIKRSAERAKDLTWQLLAFSRKQVLEMKTVDLRQVISDFQKILRRTIREDIMIKVVPSETPKFIRVDASKIGQILMNLGINAQDAMPHGGTITIEITDAVLDEAYSEIHPGASPGKYIMLAFSDTGSGMDHLTLDHIFEPFFTTKEVGKGTGLGLATVYGIVKQHGGYIMAYSEPGMGTTFKMYLPGEEVTAQDLAEEAEEAETKHGTETVLVVEDEEAVRELMCRILEKHGYTVISAGSAQECSRAVEQHKGQIHLLLTDVIMPGMNGKQLYENLAPILQGLKVIFISGYTQDVIAKHGDLIHGMNLISKPFTVKELTEKVRSVLDG